MLQNELEIDHGRVSLLSTTPHAAKIKIQADSQREIDDVLQQQLLKELPFVVTQRCEPFEPAVLEQFRIVYEMCGS